MNHPFPLKPCNYVTSVIAREQFSLVQNPSAIFTEVLYCFFKHTWNLLRLSFVLLTTIISHLRFPINLAIFATLTLHEKCPNTELFLVCILLHSVRIQKNTDHKKINV